MDDDFLNAIDNFEDLIPNDPLKLENDVLICECFCVSVKEIRDFCKSSQQIDTTCLTKHLNMGKSCGSCIKNLNNWIKRI